MLTNICRSDYCTAINSSYVVLVSRGQALASGSNEAEFYGLGLESCIDIFSITHKLVHDNKLILVIIIN